MGEAATRQGETAAEHAERAFLAASDRPEPESGRALRVVDVFSGCGGLSLGVEEACRAVGRSFKAVAAFDSDRHALATYARNFPNAMTWLESVAKLFDGPFGGRLTSGEREIRRKIGNVDVLLAGPPCQGWSSLNNYTRGQDPKNRLYGRVARIAQVLEPRIVMIENVMAARAAPASARTVDRLEALGYSASEAVASLVKLGVAQTRRRHVVLAVEASARDVS